MKFMQSALLALAVVANAAAAGTGAAQKWRPTGAQSDAFVRAYAFTVMEALMGEALQIKVESGKLSPAVAACLRQHMQLVNLYQPLRPIVADAFTSRQSLAQATAFLTSPAGIKIKELSVQQLRGALRQSSGASAAAGPAPQLAVTREEATATDKFSHSQAGRDFSRFVDVGLPQLGNVDVFGDAAEQCVHDHAH